jgi:HK97 gp10 family phage protein
MSKRNPVVSVDGFDELNAALRAVGNRTTGLVLEKAAKAGAEVIAAQAKRLAPRDTGALADGIDVEPGRLQQGRAQYGISYNKRQWYGRLIELGTKFMPAHPFLRPAMDTKAEEASDAVGASLRDSLRDVLE